MNKYDKEILIFFGVLAFIFMIVPSIFIDVNTTRAKLDDYVVEETVQTKDLLSLQLSKEQVESSSFEGLTGGSILGNVGYVQGSSEGKPVTYIYLRYRAENGDIVDRLIPRDRVRLRDDLEPGAAATVEVETTKYREPTYEDIQKDPALCYDVNLFHGHSERDKREDRSALPAEKCGKHPDDKPGDWIEDSVTPTVIHVPKDSVIVTINPNMVPDGAKKG
jgi:hypothetical protein